MLSPHILREGIRIGAQSFWRKAFGWKRYSGDAPQICAAIVANCWNGRYFQTSAGHFNEFYARDFGWCAEALCSLGHRERVLKTLEYALSSYRCHGQTRVAIAANGTPFDFPDVYAPDSLAYLLRSLRVADSRELVRKHQHFLESEIRRFHSTVIDPSTRLVRRKRHYGSMKDYSIRDASCYDHTMSAAVSIEADHLGLANPLHKYDLQDGLVTHYWNGNHFQDEINDGHYVAADANIFPFWMGVISDRRKLARTIGSVQKAGLDRPFPIRYTRPDATIRETPFAPIVKNWELDCIWGHLGMAYITILSRIEKQRARKHLAQYEKQIEKYGTFFEVYTPDGSAPYTSLLYHADEAMLWASAWLALAESLRP
ncbi:hypothetical protein HY641_05060 [Candidatus Woesearchaeota archaeon]|nr:hypothetical protein [Candidatus Woesearchaeota archaeon]